MANKEEWDDWRASLPHRLINHSNHPEQGFKVYVCADHKPEGHTNCKERFKPTCGDSRMLTFVDACMPQVCNIVSVK